MALRLRVPAAPELRGAESVIHWLKRPGDFIGPNEAVAVLGARTELRAPENAAGQVDKLLAAEGERVINRQPLLRKGYRLPGLPARAASRNRRRSPSWKSCRIE
jgi:hypothetical protein